MIEFEYVFLETKVEYFFLKKMFYLLSNRGKSFGEELCLILVDSAIKDKQSE